jgi:hypothetical protein
MTGDWGCTAAAQERTRHNRDCQLRRFFLLKRIVILSGMKSEAMNEAEGSHMF